MLTAVGHMTRNAEASTVLDDILKIVVEALGPECVYLFGSRARGDASPDSDFDLLVVVPDDAPLGHRRGRAVYEKLWGTGVAADLVVWTRSRFESRRHLVSSLPATVLREGRIVYAA
jgi:uncharacterized protein